jgi:predicted transposase
LTNKFQSNIIDDKVIEKKGGEKMDITITAKIKILPTEDQKGLLLKTIRAIKEGLNYVSEVVFETEIPGQAKLIKMTYDELRLEYGLRSQMAQRWPELLLLSTKQLNRVTKMDENSF